MAKEIEIIKSKAIKFNPQTDRLPKIQDQDMIDPTDEKERKFYEKEDQFTSRFGYIVPPSLKQEHWLKKCNELGGWETDRRNYLRKVKNGPIYNRRVEKIKPVTVKISFNKEWFETLKDAITKGYKYFSDKDNWKSGIGGLQTPLQLTAKKESFEELKDFCKIQKERFQNFPSPIKNYWIYFDEIDLESYVKILDTIAYRIYDKTGDFEVLPESIGKDIQSYEDYIEYYKEYNKFVQNQQKRKWDCIYIIEQLKEAIDFAQIIDENEKRIAEENLDIAVQYMLKNIISGKIED